MIPSAQFVENTKTTVAGVVAQVTEQRGLARETNRLHSISGGDEHGGLYTGTGR